MTSETPIGKYDNQVPTYDNNGTPWPTYEYRHQVSQCDATEYERGYRAGYAAARDAMLSWIANMKAP